MVEFSLLASLGLSVVSSQIDKKVVNPVEKFILNSAEDGAHIPANHHLERGTYRAAIMASHFCVKQVKPSAKLMHPRGKVEDYRYYGARDQLVLRLKRLEKGLEPENDASLISKWRGKRQKAMADCAAIFQDQIATSIAPDLDAAGMKALALQNVRKVEGAPDAPRDFRALRELWTPDLAGKLCKTLAEWGAWPKNRQAEIARIFEETFFDETEQWLRSFALFYVEEIRNDPELHVTATMLRAETAQQALERLEAGAKAAQEDAVQLSEAFEASFSDIRARIEEIQDSIDDIAELLRRGQDNCTLGSRQVFFPPAGGNDDFKPFHFSEEEEDFVGRETILEWLEKEVLETDASFSWAAISGPAGMGKSRLALNVMNDYLAQFRHSGFVTESAISDPMIALSSSDDIDGPTLFILDYAGSAPEQCAKFLARCALVGLDAAYPVRALVLVRRPDDEFFAQVENGREYGQLRDAQIKSDDPTSQNGEMALPPLDEGDILGLMRSRMASTAVHQATEEGIPEKAVKAFEDKELVKALEQYEANEGRPLYALLIADGLQRGMEVVRGEGETVEDARLRLLWDYLSGQYNRRWQPASQRNSGSNDIAGEKLDRHLSFAALSTLCRGLTDDAWKKLFEDSYLGADAEVLLPAHRRSRNGAGLGAMMEDQQLLPSIVGARRGAQEMIFPAMEPDLIGEALLLGLFHEPGEKWSETHGTAEDRREYLIDLAWQADPAGAAYFANLVAQDFPKSAEAAGWLLPKVPRKEHQVPRARLLRNLASLILSGFHEQAATLDDVRRLDRLIRLFDFSEDVEEEAISKYAHSLAAIAEELSFVINKSIVPSTRLQAELLVDPQKSERKRGFEQASSKEAKGISEQFQDTEASAYRSTPNEILGRKSDSKTVELTMRVLRRIFRVMPSYIERDYSFEVRDALSESLSWALTSVFWENRSAQDKFGYAPTKMSEKEKVERSEFIAAIEALIPDSDPDEETVGLVSRLIYAALFAEAGTVLDRGDRTYSKIRELASAGSFQNGAALSNLISFLRNYSINQRRRGDDSHSFGAKHKDGILECLENLFEFAIGLPNLQGKQRERTVNSYLGVVLWSAAGKEDLSKAHTEMRPAVQRYLDFCDKHGFQPPGGDAVDFFSFMAASAEEDDEESIKQFQRFLKLVEETGFNARTLNNPFWENLGWSLLQFMRCAPNLWPTSRGVVERLVVDVGKRAEESLAGILNLPSQLEGISAERGTALVPILESEPLDFSKTRLGLFGKALLDSNDSHLVDEIRHWWVTDNTEVGVKQRTFALQILMLLLPWRGVHDPIVAPYKSFLLDVFQNDASDTLANLSDLTRRKYHAAVSDAAGMFAQLEIADGGSPDTWIKAIGAK